MKIETYTDKAGEHRWRLRAANGKVIASGGEGYKNFGDMANIITSIQTSMAFAERVPVDK